MSSIRITLKSHAQSKKSPKRRSLNENPTDHSYVKPLPSPAYRSIVVSSGNIKKHKLLKKNSTISAKKVKPYEDTTRDLIQSSKINKLPSNEELSNQINFSNENKTRKKSKLAKYCRCTRLYVFCLLLTLILIGTAIVAAILALLNTSKATTEVTTRTTMSTTTATTTTVTSTTTTTSTTELTTKTYEPTGIWKLHIPTCATWDASGTTLAGNENGLAGTSVASLDFPASIFVDNNFTLYVADRDNNRIIKFPFNQTNGIVVAGNGTNGSSPNQLSYPKGVAVDQEGAIIVADGDNYRIQRFPIGSLNGTTIASNNSWNILGQMRDLHIDVNNNIYVTDSDYSQVVKFIPGSGIGIVLAPTGGVGNGANQFSTPFGNFIDENGNLYVADYNNHRIQKWLPGATTGIMVAGTGVAGSTSNQLKRPQAIIVDNNGYIYIADNVNNRIMQWTTNYTAGGKCLIGCTTVAGTSPTQLNGPRDLRFDADGNLYVCDQKNHRVQKYGIIYPPNCTDNATANG